MEKQMNINGVNGRYWKIKNTGVRAQHCHDAQKRISESRPIIGYGKGALHYVENTCYHASDRDCHGLRKGEKRQIKNGQTVPAEAENAASALRG